MKVYCGNKVAISIAHKPIMEDIIKHIKIDRHFIKEKHENGLICVLYVPTTHGGRTYRKDYRRDNLIS